jgi:pyridoxal phosphate enzyme (YggS family)
MNTTNSGESFSLEVVARYQQIQERIVALGGSKVLLVAVTKGFGVEAVRAAQRAGCSAIGENYAQELIAKLSSMPPNERPQVHFIGQLQSNKVASLAPYVNVWQSVDRVSIAQAIAKRAPGARIMIQVNATGEAGKGGCAPSDTVTLVSQAQSLGLDVIGLMTVGPTSGDPVHTETAFRAVAQLGHDLGLAELSMGMSDDLDIAVPLGATMVRVGRSLFGERPPQNGI